MHIKHAARRRRYFIMLKVGVVVSCFVNGWCFLLVVMWQSTIEEKLEQDFHSILVLESGPELKNEVERKFRSSIRIS